MKQLPKDWRAITLSQFLKVTEVLKTEQQDELGVDQTLDMVAVLMNVERDSLENLTLQEVLKMEGALSFLSTMPDPGGKLPFKVKRLEDITYDDYCAFLNLSKEHLKNMPTIIRMFIHKDKQPSEQDVLNMDMATAYSFFFALNRRLNNYLTKQVNSLKRRVWISQMKKIQLVNPSPIRKMLSKRKQGG